VPQAEVPLEVQIQEQVLLQQDELILQYKAAQLSQEFTVNASSLQSDTSLCISTRNFITSLLFKHPEFRLLAREETHTFPCQERQVPSVHSLWLSQHRF
jgi:hypothetical protein